MAGDIPDMNISSLSFDGMNMTADIFKTFIMPFDVPYIRGIFIFFFSIIFGCCVLGNMTVIYVILRHRKMRNITNFFLANLAASDLCVGLFCVLPNLSTFLSPNWYLGRVMCKLYYFIQCTSYTASVLILTVISLERYFAIIRPMFNKRVTRMSLLRWIVVVVWICAASYGIPNLVAYDIYSVDTGNSTMEFCVITGNLQLDMEVYSITNFIVLYAVPLLCITFIYIRISMVLWQTSFGIASAHSGRIQAGKQKSYQSEKSLNQAKPTSQNNDGCCQGNAHEAENLVSKLTNAERSASDQHERAHEDDFDEEGLSEDEDVVKDSFCSGSCFQGNCRRTEASPQMTFDNHTENEPSVRITLSECQGTLRSPKPRVANPLVTRRKVIRLLICIIVSFAICVLPHHIRLLWQYWAKPASSFSFGHMLVPPITFLFFYANSALNPFLYALLSDHFRRAFCELLPRKCSLRDCISSSKKLSSHSQRKHKTSLVRRISSMTSECMDSKNTMSSEI